MSLNWIKLTDRARKGIEIINALPFEKFTTVLSYVNRQMIQSTTSSDTTQAADNNSMESTDSENELEKLEHLVSVPRADFLLMIKTFSYILRRISTFVLKPTRLSAELRDKLQINDEAKVEAIVRLWVRQTAPMLRNLADEQYESNVIEDVAWKLSVEISSHCQQQDKTALAMLQLKTGAGEDINMEMDHEQLLTLYNQFEAIQMELDTMIS